MKKKIIIALGALVVVVASAIAVAISNANSLVQKFRPELEKVASQAVGNSVKLGNLNVSILPSAKINVSEVVVGSSTDRQKAFTLHNLQLSISLIPLLSKTLDIVELTIDRPSISAVKDRNGITIAGLTKAAESTDIPKNSTVDSNKGPAKEKSSHEPQSGLAINLKKLSITNASLKLADLEAKKEYELSDLSVSASLAMAGQMIRIPTLSASGKLSGKSPVALGGADILVALDSGAIDAKTLDLKVLGSTINLKFAMNQKTKIGSAQLSSAGIDLSKLPELSSLVPALKDLAILGSAKPNLAIDLAGGALKGSGKIDLVGVGLKTQAIQISDINGSMPVRFDNSSQGISAKDLGVAINGAALKAQFKASKVEDSLDVESFEVKGLGGVISGNTNYNLKSSLFGSTVTIANLSIEQAIEALAPGKPAVLTGNLEKVSFVVNGNAQNPKETISGPVSVRVVNGVLKGINVAADVLKKADNIPFISGALYGVVPEQYKKDLESPDTPIKSLAADCRLGGAGMDCSGISVESTLFSLSASGRLNFDSSINLKASIAFAQPLSAGIGAKVKELNSILDAQGRLVIPLQISGSPSSLHITPDTNKLIELGAKNVVKKEAERLIDRALGGKGKGKGLGGLFKF